MANGKSKILKHIWETGGGFIYKGENVTIVTNSHLDAVGIQVNDAGVLVEFALKKGQNIALIHNLRATRGSLALHHILTGVCIEDKLYTPVDTRIRQCRYNGSLIDNYTILLVEKYVEK